jgi:hypothetical protein
MLWRAGYEPTFFEDVEIPVLVGTYVEDDSPWSLAEGEVLLFGFDFQAYSEIALWRKMLYPHEPAIGFFSADRLRHVLPPSWMMQTALLAPDLAWREVIPAAMHHRAMALYPAGDRAKQLHLGPPTEESLERLLELL